MRKQQTMRKKKSIYLLMSQLTLRRRRRMKGSSYSAITGPPLTMVHCLHDTLKLIDKSLITHAEIIL